MGPTSTPLRSLGNQLPFGMKPMTPSSALVFETLTLRYQMLANQGSA